ncbi:MAG TPA: phosphoglucomutase/phosphomannomutase family protein [Bacillota bacterium]|nr:phosphoglucomutase/phosphomannomutase family protein [Bacillota bacterium]
MAQHEQDDLDLITFGTGGWRAIIGEIFTRENVVRVAAGVCELAAREKRTGKPVVIGYDRRFLSDSAARWIAEVFCAQGFHVLFMKRSAPTPLVMFLVKDMELDYGIEVTASHNPPYYNGIKLIVREGRDAPVETTRQLEEIIANIRAERVPRIPFNECVEKGLVEYLKHPFNRFIDSILSKLDIEAIRERDLRVLFNPMHGSGTYPLMAILYTARCTVDLVGGEKDAYFGGRDPAPTGNSLKDFRDSVVSGKYDLGIAFDGDADRLGIIDSNGRYITANETLCLLYYYLHEHKGWRGPVVRNVATTHMLDKIAASFGEVCYEVPVGFKYISAAIDQYDAVLGGESSGGLTVRGHIHGKDSIYAASLFVEMICKTGKSPSVLMDELTFRYGSYVMVEDNSSFHPDDRGRITDLIMTSRSLPDFGDRRVKRVSYADGCKVVFENDSFVLCRFSGTEPLIRICAEASSEAEASELIEIFKKFISDNT